MSGLLLRPIREHDLADVFALAESEKSGLTSLPADADFLERRLADSRHAFRPSVRRAGDQFYLFGLEDLEEKKVVGVSGIAAKVGGFEPFYSYEIRRETHHHAPLGVAGDFDVLHLVKEHDGPTEICTLYLRPESRKGGGGRLLSLARFLFMATFPERFEKTVISELRGVSHPAGGAPFWNAVGANFFNTDFRSADFQSGIGDKRFIADLMPHHPIYTMLLPESARESIGQVHEETRPARALLEQEGFRFGGKVDIFDAGPLLLTLLAEIRTVRERRVCQFAGVREIGHANGKSLHLVANARLDFRATTATVIEENAETVWLDVQTAELLELQPGDELSYAPLHGAR